MHHTAEVRTWVRLFLSTWESIINGDKSIHLSVNFYPTKLHFKLFVTLPTLFVVGAKCQFKNASHHKAKYLTNNSWVWLFDRHTISKCKILWETVRWSDPIYLPKFNFFFPSAAVTIWVSSGCQMSCYASLSWCFLLGKIKGEKNEMWVPKRSTHFYGWPGQMMPLMSRDDTKICLSLTRIFPLWLFFSRPYVRVRKILVFSTLSSAH